MYRKIVFNDKTTDLVVNIHDINHRFIIFGKNNKSQLIGFWGLGADINGNKGYVLYNTSRLVDMKALININSNDEIIKVYASIKEGIINIWLNDDGWDFYETPNFMSFCSAYKELGI